MGATNFHTSFEEEEEDYVEMFICCPNSQYKPNKQSFEFQRPFNSTISSYECPLLQWKAHPFLRTSPLPFLLHPPQLRPCPRTEVDPTSLDDEEEDLYYTITFFSPSTEGYSTTITNTTFSDSCSSISPMEFCDGDECFSEWSAEGKKLLPRIMDKLKMSMKRLFHVHTSRATMKSLVMKLICRRMPVVEAIGKKKSVDTCISRSCSGRWMITTCFRSSSGSSRSCSSAAFSSSFDSNDQHVFSSNIHDELVEEAIAHCKKSNHHQIWIGSNVGEDFWNLYV